MAKKNSKKRHYQKKKRETRVKTYAENYYKRQSNAINRLKPVMAAARHLNDRAAQAERSKLIWKLCLIQADHSKRD